MRRSGKAGIWAIATGLLCIGAIPASAMWLQGQWVNGRPNIDSGDMLFEGCLRPGVESSCKVIDGTSSMQRTDGQGRPVGQPMVNTYAVVAASPMPAYDRRLVVLARPSKGRARICGGEAVEIKNWYYKDGPPCPERDSSPFDG
jgi:hypothetical protein